MPREDISMSPAEIEGFVNTIEWMVLGVLDQDGGPQGSVVPTSVSEGLLYFAVPAGSPAAASLARDPRCCCTVDVFPSYNEIRGATIHGAAQPVGSTSNESATIAGELAARAGRHGLAGGRVFAIPLLGDAFGFDFGKLQR